MPKATQSANESRDDAARACQTKPVYAVFGPDDFLRQQALDQIARQVLGPDPSPMARTDIDGAQAELAEVLDEVRTLPFLSDARLVVVRDADALIAKHREALERYAAAPSSTGVLVLVCRTMNRQWRLTKAIQKVGSLIECKAPPPRERDKWLATRARETYGKELQPQAARALVESVGEDMARLDAELAKLDIYIGDRKRITADDVEALVGVTRPEKVFAMTDAMAEGDAATAVRLWHRTLASDSQAPYRAVGGIAWAVRQMIASKQGSPGWISPATRRAASRFSVEQLQDMLVQLLAADVASKTGLGTVQSAVEKFIVRQCAGR